MSWDIGKLFPLLILIENYFRVQMLAVCSGLVLLETKMNITKTSKRDSATNIKFKLEEIVEYAIIIISDQDISS